MFSTKEYATMTLDELMSEEKKMNSRKIPFALFIGLLVGFAVWSATHNGGFVVTVILLISAILSGSVYTKNLKSLQTEISRRNTVG
ncbi:hypothetical protein [Spirosoma pulveris]